MDKLQKAQQLLKALEGYGSITDAQLVAFVQDIVNVFSQYKSATKEINQETKDTLNLIVKQVNAEHDRIVGEVKNETSTLEKNVTKSLKKALADVKTIADGISTVEPKNGEDGAPGKDADEEAIFQRLLSSVPRVEKLEPETAETIAEKLNKKEGIINATVIKGMGDLVRHIGSIQGGRGDSSNPISILSSSVLVKSGASKLNFTGATVTQDGDTTTIAVTGGSGSGIIRSIFSVSSPTTAAATASTDYVYFVSGTTTLTLPTAVGNTNRYTVKNTGAAVVTIATTSAQTIDGGTTYTLNVPYAVDLISDGANWRIV